MAERWRVVATLVIRGAADMRESEAKQIAKRIAERKITGIFVTDHSHVALRISRGTSETELREWLGEQAQKLLKDRANYNNPYTARLHQRAA